MNEDKPYKVFTPLGWVSYKELWEAQQTADLYNGKVFRETPTE